MSHFSYVPLRISDCEIKFTMEYLDPKKDNTCQKELLVVYWVQIHNQSLVAIVYSGLSRTPYQGETTE